jgi:hypothetical protein
MGNPNPLSLAFEITADPSKAEAAMEQVSDSFNAAVEKLKAEGLDATEAMNLAWDEMDKETQKVGRDVQQLGYDYARSMKSATSTFSQGVRENVADLTALRRAFYSTVGLISVSYAVTEWEDLGEEIKSAALDLGGFTETAQRFYAEWVKDNDKLLFSFKNVATGMQLINQTNLDLARLEKLREGADTASFAAKKMRENWWLALLGPFGIAAAEATAAKATHDHVSDINNQIATLQDRLVKQLGQLTELREKEQKDRSKLHEQHGQLIARSTEDEKQALREMEQRRRRVLETQRQLIEGFQRLYEEQEQFALRGDVLETRAENDSYRRNLEELNRRVEMQKRMIRMKQEEIRAEEQAAAAARLAKEETVAGLANVIGGQRAYAAVMAGIETAEGFAALGAGDFWAAAQDFISAAEFAKAAGSGGGGRAGGGGTYAGGGSSSGSRASNPVIAPGGPRALTAGAGVSLTIQGNVYGFPGGVPELISVMNLTQQQGAARLLVGESSVIKGR